MADGSSGPARILKALRNPNYGVYTAGNAVSLVGTWTQRVAVGWLAWQLTESGAWLGAVAFADLFPTVIVGPIGGAFADRSDRIRLIKISQVLACLQAVALFLLTLTGLITPELLLGLTLFLGIVAAFNQPARLALIPSLVPREDLPAAVAVNSLIFNLARFVGPMVAGLAILAGGVETAFAINACTFIAFVVALSYMSVPFELDSGRPKRSVLADLKEALDYTVGHAGIGPLMLLLIAVNLGSRPLVELLPGFAAQVFSGGAGALAVMTSTIGVGAIVGGLWLAQRPSEQGMTVALFRTTLVQVGALGLFLATTNLWVGIAALAIVGFCWVVNGSGVQTLFQLRVDPKIRGRVLSLYGLINRGGPAIGALAMGTASEAVGLRWPLAAGALLVLAAWAWIRVQGQSIAGALEVAPPDKQPAPGED